MQPDAHQQAGFTLIETLVALAVLSASVAAISSLSTSGRIAVLSTVEHVQDAFFARRLLAERSNRAAPLSGVGAGETDGFSWRMDLRAFAIEPRVRERLRWNPYYVTVQMRGPGGGRLAVQTIRLGRPQ